jgi:branched-chain amino acid transport system permease protein
VAAFGKLRRLWTAYLALGGTALAALAGIAAMIEMVYHLQLNPALGPQLKFLGIGLDAKGFDSWFGAVFLLVVGASLFELTRREFVRQWGQTQEEIEKEIKRREAL